MHPVLASAGPFTLHSYGVALLLASGVAVLCATLDAEQLLGVAKASTLEIALVTLVAAVVASKLALLAVEGPGAFAGAAGALRLVRSAGLLHAAFLGGLLATLVAARRAGLRVLAFLDAIAPAAALGAAIGRLGCLAAGCCFGAPTHVPWAIVYSDPLAHALAGTPLGVPLHPLPLYALAAELAVFATVAVLARQEVGTGLALGGWLVLEGGSRLALEPFRGERSLVLGGPLTAGQALATGLVILGSVLLLRRARARRARGGNAVEVAP